MCRVCAKRGCSELATEKKARIAAGFPFETLAINHGDAARQFALPVAGGS